MKTKEESLKDYNLVEESVQNKCKHWEWEDVAMWMQTPKNFLLGKTPIYICASENISYLLNFINTKDIENEK